MKTEQIKIVRKNCHNVIFEKGWWMDRDEYDRLVRMGDKLIIEKNDETRQLTTCFAPIIT